MKRCVLILALALAALQPLAGQCLPKGKDAAFKPGEKITFALTYKWGAVQTEVASAILAVDSVAYKGSPAYKSVLQVKSAPFFDVFFKMRENFQGWMEPQSLRPLKFIRDTHEGNYDATNLYIYDWDSRVIHADVNFDGRGPQTMDIPLKDCVFDIGSILYYARGMDVKRLYVGGKYPLSFAIDDSVFDIMLTYKGKENLKVRKYGGKTIRCMKFSCSVVSGAMFTGDEEFLLWISDDGNRLPVTFMAPLRVGAVWGWLKGTEGLKYDFSSIVK